MIIYLIIKAIRATVLRRTLALGSQPMRYNVDSQ